MSSIGDELEMSTAASGRSLGGAFEEEERRNEWRLMRRRSRCRLDHSKYEATRQSSMPACEPDRLDPQPIKRHQHHPFPIPFPP